MILLSATGQVTVSKLEILTGQYAQHQFLIESDKVWIGSDTSCDICLQEPGVSRKHAQIVRGKGAALWIEDAGGSFGTLLNGQSIDRAELRPGDELTLGRTKLRLLEEKTQFAVSPFVKSTTLEQPPSISAIPPEQLSDIVMDLEGPAEPTNVSVNHAPSATVVASIEEVRADEWEGQSTSSQPGFVEVPSETPGEPEFSLQVAEHDGPSSEFEVLSEDDMLDDWVPVEDEEDALAGPFLIDDDEDDHNEPLHGTGDAEGTVFQPIPVRPAPLRAAAEAAAPIPAVSTQPPPMPVVKRLRKKVIVKHSTLEEDVLGDHTLTGVRKDEVVGAASGRQESGGRSGSFHIEIARLRDQLMMREEQIKGLNKTIEEQSQNEVIETTLSLYKEDNERLKHQLKAYEEAAEENELLLKRAEQLEQEIDDLSEENQMLRQRLLQYRKMLIQHGLLRRRRVPKP